MRYFAYLAFIISLFSCQQQEHKPSPPLPPHKEDSILIRIGGGNLRNMDSCVYISYDLEADSSYNMLLRQYICEYEYGYDSAFPPASLAKLTSRPSFTKMILLFFNRDDYKRISYSDEHYRLDDIARSLLYGIQDSCCTEKYYAIADSLLGRDYFDGVEVLWEHADVQKLPSLKGYMTRVDTGNFYKLAELAAFLHNVGQYDQRDIFMSKAARAATEKKQYTGLRDLITRQKTFDKGTYNELIYGED